MFCYLTNKNSGKYSSIKYLDKYKGKYKENKQMLNLICLGYNKILNIFFYTQIEK